MTNDQNQADQNYVRRVGEENRRYTQDLLSENENLRLMVSELQRERKLLIERGANGLLLDELTQLRELQAQHQIEQTRLQAELAEIEARSRHFSEEYVEVERRNNDLMNLYVASYRLHGTVDRAEVLGTIQEIVANLVGCEESGIFELNPETDELRLIASVGIDEAAFERVPLGEGVIGRAAVDGETFVAETPSTSEDATKLDQLTACIPLKLNGKVTGAIALFRLLPQKPTLEGVDHEMFDLLATHAATALYCTTLHARHGDARVASEVC